MGKAGLRGLAGDINDAPAMAISQQLAVTRQRLDTLERVLEANGISVANEIEHFAPSADAAAERGLWMQEYISRVLRIVQQGAEGMEAATKGDLYSAEVAVEVSKDEL